MNRQLIAILGSVGETREYEPRVRDTNGARQTAEELGKALAVAGYGLMVYSAESDFIERDVVKGFINSGKARPKSILVLFPSGHSAAAAFAERESHEEVFDIRQEPSSEWEMAFFRSLADADGVILIGGGRSTLITGIIALTYRIPLIALAAYGGSAEKVWKSLIAGRDLPTEAAIRGMAQAGKPEAVKGWISSLDAQRKLRKKEIENRSRVWGSIAALILLVVWVSALPIGFLMIWEGGSAGSAEHWHRTVFIFLLFIAPLVSGASGASIRTLLPTTGAPSLKTTILGVAAGAIASTLYVLGQVVGNPAPYNFPVLAFSVAFGFIAGFTFDTVFKKLSSVDALQSDVLTAKKG